MGTRFGKYVVERELGRGGFGRVYCAFDADMNRRVAVKVLACESDPDLMSRFQAEAGMTARLAHRNIVTVYEFAQQDGLPYLVMELLEGKTLYEVIGSGAALPLLEKAEIMYQVAEGLQHAHQRGVIHRDIKPGNIMVLPDGRVKIMDFGIARLVQREGARRTREGDLIGTVSYMAPEMFRDHEPDKKTDIFAYGVLYYELLTGQHPFHAEDPFAIVKRIENDDPAPLRRQQPECPEALAILLQHLLMKDREMRLEELSDVLFDTEPILRELRQERAASLAREIEPLIQMGDCEMAYARVKQILELDPAREEARLWREQIRSRLNRQRAEKLRRQGMEHMSVARFREAVTCFESVLHLDTHNSEILTLLEQARGALERVRHSAELVGDARVERQKGHVEEALSKVSQAVELDPANQEAVSLRHSLRKQIRELHQAASLEEAKRLRAAGTFDSALTVLDGIEADLQSDARVRSLRAQILGDRNEAERRRRMVELGGMLDKAREALTAGLFDQAAEAAQSICLKFPEEPAAVAFRKEVRDRIDLEERRRAVDLQKYQAGLSMAEQAYAAQDYTKAKEALDPLRLGAPDARAEQLYEVVSRQIRRLGAKHQAQANPQRRPEDARQPVAEPTANSVKDSRKGPSETPRVRRQHEPSREATYRERSGEIRKAKSEPAEQTPRLRDQAISEGRQRAAVLAKEASLVAAIAVLEKLARRYPNSSEVRRDLEAARRELVYQREIEKRGDRKGEGQSQRKQIDKKRREAMALLRQGELGGAMAVIKDLLKQHRK
jgi:eukaryotic-like serine/threonine-protein kinase